MKKYFMSLTLAAILGSSLMAKSASKEAIMSMMEKSGAISTSEKMVDQLFTMFEQQNPKNKDMLNKLKNKFDVKDLLNEMIPVYQKYYSAEDIENLNKFYATPTGQKMIKTMPDIAKESMVVSQQWAQKLAKTVQEESQK